jgi:catechol 2,3-dioxygenase-like lactoylglutathione lyase family enzyme
MAESPIRNNIVLELHVPDFAPAREFYGLLGFEEISYDSASDDSEGGLGYLVLSRHDDAGDTMLNFYGDRESVAQHSQFGKLPADTPRGYAVEITIVVASIEQLWSEVSPKLAPESVSQPLQIKPWGKKDLRLVDPYGFYVRFTEIVDWGQ